ncbi:hypothetical protein QP786_00235 [Gleimia europaea]|nr:hypothetical protein [Gleimia europaea]MDK8534659.1 hypothetical protein [Gleimia europaea]
MAKEIELTQTFRETVEKTGMKHSAIADGMKVSRQFFSAVWLGKEQPTTRFALGAIKAGLGETFDDVIIYKARETEQLSA